MSEPEKGSTAYEIRKTRVFWAGIILALCAGYVIRNWEQDATDKGFWDRSNMQLHTDAQTGCQYLSAGMAGLHPRLDAGGQHICGAAP